MADSVDIELGIGKGVKYFATQSSATETADEICAAAIAAYHS